MITSRSPYPWREFFGMAWRRFTPPPPWGTRPVASELILQKEAKDITWIGFVGDICPLRNRKAMYAPEIIHFFRDCSLMVGNFEGVISNQRQRPFLHKHTPSIFDALGQIKPLDRWVLSIANNHAVDYGKEALHGTVEIFNNLGVQWLGTNNQRSITIKNLGISFTAWTWWVNGHTTLISQEDPGPPKEDALHIALPHWGYEHERSPRPGQYHRLPSGYNLVVGHHSHLPQCLEFTGKGLPVAWSLGNFLTAKRLAVLGEGAILKAGFIQNNKSMPLISSIFYQAIQLDRKDPGYCRVYFRPSQ